MSAGATKPKLVNVKQARKYTDYTYKGILSIYDSLLGTSSDEVVKAVKKIKRGSLSGSLVVKLKPQSKSIRMNQHRVAEHNKLYSSSVGREPNRSVIFGESATVVDPSKHRGTSGVGNKGKKRSAKNKSSISCPKCNGKMVLRNGRYGEFYGCNRYPKCNGTLNF